MTMNSNKAPIAHSPGVSGFALSFTPAFALVIALVAALTLTGCASRADKKAVSPWSASFSAGKDGVAECSLSSALLPKTAFRGVVSGDQAGKKIMTIESVDWFNNWIDGWTEATIVASGKLSLEPADPANPAHGWKVTVIEEPALEYATSAMIRYRDNVLYGDQAIGLLNRRIERVKVAALYLRTALKAQRFESIRPDKKKFRAASFEYAAGPLLFPEMYGYPEGTSKSPSTKENRARGEGLSWDTRYTAERLTVELQEVRDSGTLYRDWEESAELFYFLAFPWIDLPIE